MQPSERVLLTVSLAVAATGVLVCAGLFAVAGIPSWMPPAASLGLGIPSPLSGMTRSVVALARGDLTASFHWHPLGPLVLVGVVLTAIVGWWLALTETSLPRWAGFLSSRRAWLVLASAFAAVWIRQIVVLG
jgi:hypothetical protein